MNACVDQANRKITLKAWIRRDIFLMEAIIQRLFSMARHNKSRIPSFQAILMECWSLSFGICLQAWTPGKSSKPRMTHLFHIQGRNENLLGLEISWWSPGKFLRSDPPFLFLHERTNINTFLGFYPYKRFLYSYFLSYSFQQILHRATSKKKNSKWSLVNPWFVARQG